MVRRERGFRFVEREKREFERRNEEEEGEIGFLAEI